MWMKFWDAWHLGKILGGEGNLFHTNDIFYPQGTTLAFQAYSLPHALLMNALDAIMPASNAYTLAFLLLIFASALSAYIYLCWLLKDKWLALAGAVVFGCSQWVMGVPHMPDVGFVAMLPLSLYCLQRGIVEGRAGLCAIAGALIGLSAYSGMYIFVCHLITVGFCALWWARARWRRREFWLRLALMAIICGGLSGIRVAVMLSDAALFDSAMRMIRCAANPASTS